MRTTVNDGPRPGDVVLLKGETDYFVVLDHHPEGGWRLVTNVGPDAGQTVFHLHFHVLGGAPMGRLVHPS